MCLFKKRSKSRLVSFSATDGDYDFVDLGLSVKWANKNIGAGIQEGVGAYFNYDEVKKTGVCLPTVDEVRELFEKCKIRYNKKSNGFDVTGVNGNKIFLPIGGEREGNAHYEGSYFWTCSDHERGYMEGYKYYGCVYLGSKVLKKVKTGTELLRRGEFWINVREVKR